MKKLFVMVVVATALLASSCGAQKTQLAPAVESKITTVTSLEGNKVNQEIEEQRGVEVMKDLDENGNITEKSFLWYSGHGKADDKQTAIVLAQREAYATISRVLNNAVMDESKEEGLGNNGHVQRALQMHWKQVSTSLEKGCEPLGSAKIQYDPTTRMYDVTAKVGIRGDRFVQLLNTAGDFKPSDLKGEELEDFIKTNRAIMEAVKSKF